MKYQLLPNSQRGILTDRTPIMADIKDTCTVSFLLPSNNAFVAVFKDEKGTEHRKPIIDGECKVPKELLKFEQFVDLTVCELDGDRVTAVWLCEPLNISTFLHATRSLRQISGGTTDKDCLTRLSDLEQLYDKTLAELSALRELAKNAAELVDRFMRENELFLDEFKQLKQTNSLLSERTETLENGKFTFMRFNKEKTE